MKKIAILLAAALSVGAQRFPDTPESRRLKAVTARYKAMVDAGQLAGAVLAVERHGNPVMLDAVGFQDAEAKKAMRTDSIFQMMSMSKPVTAVGLMTLVDEGKVLLTEPVEKYLPEFRDVQVQAPEGLRKPARRITVADLLDHTSGMSVPPPEMRGKLNGMTLAEAVALYPKQPLLFDPGTKFRYSNTGIATAGRIIEAVSGQSFERFIEDRIFTPLGMRDSYFVPDDSKASRVAVYYRLENGVLHRGTAARGERRYPAPESGLYSTAHDMLAFHQMMLAGGAYNGTRVLSPTAVEVMTSVHTGTLETKDPGFGWGLGWHVVRDATGMLGMMSRGAFGHGGAWTTYGFVDRAKDLVGVLMVQHEGPNEDVVRGTFIEMVNAAVDREDR